MAVNVTPSPLATLNKNNNQYSLKVFLDSKNHCEHGYHQIELGTILCHRYTINKKLGSGSSSIVWKCWDQKTKRFVALKILKSFHIKEAMYELKMLQHVNSHKQNHSKFIQLLDHFKLSGVNCTHICIVLELMKGSLVDLAKTKHGTELIHKNSKSIIKQVLECLNCLHRNSKLIHTDIKPDNILYHSGYDITIKIGDFGSACPISQPISMGRQTGTYRSNEFLLQANYTQAADIWSTACLAFLLATGTPLFQSIAGENYTRNEDHLACTIALLGEIPKHVALSGKRSLEFFTEDGKPRHISQRKPKGLVKKLIDEHKWDVDDALLFADFLLPLLTFDPLKRPSAQECLKHPWLTDNEVNCRIF